MPDNGFVPFAPRRLRRPGDSAIAEVERAAARVVEEPPETEVAQGPVMAEDGGRIESETGDADVPLPAQDSSTAHRCTDVDAACIRAAAIRYAAAACARALRYAIDRNPRLIARFVDDALRAAGSPHNAVVRVAPAVTSVGAASKEHDFVADSSLAPGDVFVDCPAGTLGAMLEERAELLVRAVAS